MGISLYVNQQPIEKFINSDGSKLDVVDIWRTLQGEGPFIGTPAIFIRLTGCNLCCPCCDTEYQKRDTFTIQEITTNIRVLSENMIKLVVLTGGEPFRQVLGPFVKTLLDIGYRVQLETNGTLYDDSMKQNQYNPNLSIICSPKAQVKESLKPHITALKYILRAGYINPNNGLPTQVLGNNFRPEYPWTDFVSSGKKVYVQACDEGEGNEEQTRENLFVTVESAMRFGYIFTPQLHKMIGLP